MSAEPDRAALTDAVKRVVIAESRLSIQPSDIAEAVRFLLKQTKGCLVPEIVFTRPGDPSL